MVIDISSVIHSGTKAE